MEDEALVVEGLRKRYGSTPVLGGVSFALSRGVILGLVGPNGAGKTTCLKIVAGTLRADEGEVRLDGSALGRLGLAGRARAGLGCLSQGGSVFRALTVWENLCAVPGATREARQRVLEQIGLASLAGAMGERLSGGERRRLEIGRLMLMRGLKVLLCDEPFAALDPEGVLAVSALLRSAASRGCAVLVTDHHVDALFALCDEVALLVDGKIARRTAPDELSDDPALRRYLGYKR